MITMRFESPMLVLAETAGLRPEAGRASDMKPIRSMEITLESRPMFVTRGQRKSTAEWCPTCGNGFRLVAALTAASLADASIYVIYRWAETGEVHFRPTADGALLVCLDSLLERANAQQEAATELTTA